MTSLVRSAPGVQYGTARQPVWSAPDRAADYRERAAQLVRMAADETQPM